MEHIRMAYLYMNRRFWICAAVGLLLLVLARHGNTVVWAGTQHQTVPIPTATPLDTPVPTATPSQDQPEPTPSPTPEIIENEIPSADEEELTDQPASEIDAQPAPDSPPTESEQLLSASVLPIVLNVREGPGVDYAVMGTAFQEDRVEVLGRNQNWWLVCCAFGSTVPGWVDSSFLQPDFDTPTLDQLIPVVGPEPEQEVSGRAGISVQAAGESVLQFQLRHEPNFVWPGQMITVTLTATNTGEFLLSNVFMRDEFPPSLILGNVDSIVLEPDSEGDKIELVELASGATVLVATWQQLEANEAVSVKIEFKVDDSLTAGEIIDNLAVVSADNARSVTAGISIGLPPVGLPRFQ